MRSADTARSMTICHHVKMFRPTRPDVLASAEGQLTGHFRNGSLTSETGGKRTLDIGTLARATQVNVFVAVGLPVHFDRRHGGSDFHRMRR
jgi:hypothetical protein